MEGSSFLGLSWMKIRVLGDEVLFGVEICDFGVLETS